jgi:hypothetical protein
VAGEAYSTGQKGTGSGGAEVDEGCSRVMEGQAKWMEGKMESTEPYFVITEETLNHQLKSQVTYDYRTPT